MICPDFYFVVTDFPTQGFGSAGDPQENRNTAVSQFAELYHDDMPRRAFRVEFCAGSNTLETVSDVTEDFEQEVADLTC